MTNSNRRVAVVITAAGSSTRMGGTIKKEYLTLGNGTVLSSCVKAFLDASVNQTQPFEISHIIITIPQGDESQVRNALSSLYKNKETEGLIKDKLQFVTGGESRQQSVFNALEAIKKSDQPCNFVLIHDGARPFVNPDLISVVVQTTMSFEAAVPGITPTDTIKAIDEEGFIVSHLVRSSLTAVQTPQGFVFDILYDAHKKAMADGQNYTDDSEIWGRYYGKVKLVKGDVKNIKITYPGDLEKGAGLCFE